MTGFSRSGLSKSQPRFVRGFTIMELMVVIVIVGILSGLAIPRFLRTNAEAVLQGEAQRMLLNFRLAKQAANKTNLRHFIRIDPSTGKVEVWRADSAFRIGFDSTKYRVVIKDSLDKRVQFGFAGTTAPSKAPGGVIDGTPSATSSTSGLGVASSTVDEDCWDNKVYPVSKTPTTDGWSKGEIPVCGGPTADMAMGVAYLSTPKSDTRFYALTYVTQSIQVHLWSWNSATGDWEKI
ncbi:MAG: hypothetical protein RL173_1804 [Fibrobacterota bacterium]|jgi:prepilin-type N-terminal cleavage/methylation domain-containing protein